jgi:hypothetical protein
MVTKNRNELITQNDSFGKNCGEKNLGISTFTNFTKCYREKFFHWLKLTHVFQKHPV